MEKGGGLLEGKTLKVFIHAILKVHNISHYRRSPAVSHYAHNIAHEIEHIFTIQSQHKVIDETILKYH